MKKILEKLICNKWLVWGITVFSIIGILRTIILLLQLGDIYVWMTIPLIFYCIPTYIAVTWSLKGEIEGWN